MALPAPSSSSYWRLLTLLIAEGLISEEQRQTAVVKEAQQRVRLQKEKQAELERMGRRLRGKYVVSDAETIASFRFPQRGKPTSSVSEAMIAEVIAMERGYPFLELDPLKLDFQFVTQTLSGPYAERHSVIPIRLDGDEIVIAVADPYDDELLVSLEEITGRKIRPAVATKSDITKIAMEFWGFRTSVRAAEADLGAGSDLGNLEQFVKGRSLQDIDPNEKPVVQAVWFLFNYAFEQRASDIHIEPKREHSQVRVRIDGVLHDIHQLPSVVHNAVVSRIKMLARMDIAERRRPQAGRIKTTFENKEIELRVSTLPVAFGEKVVLRVFDPEVLDQSLEELGFFPRELELFRGFIRAPHGLILVTGPTGSGKTTTLYSALRTIASPDINVTTIEDPIEMIHEDFNQVAVQPKIGVTFAAALRTILRQDPDVIMVGEIRDPETAEQAVQAALTGHLVFSTLHTNNAASAIGRLLDLGVLPFLLSTTLLGIVAQRLVRVICGDCMRRVALKSAQLKTLGLPEQSERKLMVNSGAGCRKCRSTGYRGRSGIHEVLEVNDKIRRLIQERAPAADIQREAATDGMLMLREAAIKKMAQGVTTFDEVIRVTAES